ncbi:hypothetical protein K432DRAFT_444556 [Lepidopterella palustris CBS 459.81]|uniref:NmrA-like domain-containing protein n=1 Tax=Lepidopterella palustris CBS 459.81 TaxID=1314670 RepID=A0A8E2JDM8_9PEZI|nr:hypothetical protein K432DRAFT_444556 [Lepidopterella palustris CBS 459.81]
MADLKMESEIKKVLVIGNESLSSTILKALDSVTQADGQPAYNLTVLTYPSQAVKAPSQSLIKIAHKTSDFTPASLRSAFAGQDLIIITISGGDYSLQVRIINAAVAAGVKRCIPHEFGPDSLNEDIQARLPPIEERARIIRYLRSIQTAGSQPSGIPSVANGYANHAGKGCGYSSHDGDIEDGVNSQTSSGHKIPFEWVAVAVGCILDTKLVSGDLGFDIKWQSATIHGSGNESFAASSLQRVGEVIASIIQHWDQVKNRYLYAAGLITSANEIVGTLQKATGKEWTVGYAETVECVREGQARIERGFPDAGMFLMERSVLFDRELKAVEAFERNSANKTLGLAQESVDRVVSGAVHEFQHSGKVDCGCG